MPLGNLTSQFFANIYLNELDQFVKHKLKIRYYIRYVDDFVIFDKNKKFLEECKKEINIFLENDLAIRLHPDKSKIIKLKKGITFLGFRTFLNHRLLKKSNLKKLKITLKNLEYDYHKNKIDYDAIYDFIEGFLAYAKAANTHKLKKKITKEIETKFPNEMSSKEFNKINLTI